MRQVNTQKDPRTLSRISASSLPKGVILHHNYLYIRRSVNGKTFTQCMGPARRVGKDGEKIEELKHGVIDTMQMRAAEIERDIKLNKFDYQPERRRLLVSKALDKYEKGYCKYLASQKTAVVHLRRQFGARYVDSLTFRDLLAFRQSFTSRGCKESTANRYHDTFMHLLRWLKEQVHEGSMKPLQLPDFDQFTIKKCKQVDEDQFVRQRVLTPEEFRRLLQVSNVRLRRIYIAALNSLLRRKDLAQLKKSRINWVTNCFHIPISSKSKATVFVDINPDLQDLIDTAPGDDILDLTNLRVMHQQARARSGIPHFEFRDLRRTGATMAYAKCRNLLTVSKMLGHKTPAMTARYLMLQPEDRAKASAAISAAYHWEGKPESDSGKNSGNRNQGLPAAVAAWA